MGRADYLLRRDVGESGTGLQDLWGESLGQQAGINKYRGIGRGAGTLAGILLAGSGAGIPLLALAGGLGSLGGSLLGKHLGQQKYGDPVEAEKGGLFHRDVAKEQRESVGDYWKGMKEQIAVNTLQDAITAGMYGGQVHDIAGKFKNIPSQLSSKAADLGFNKTAIRLGGQPAGMAMPPSIEASRAAIQQPDISGIFPDMPTRLKLPGVVHPPSAYPSVAGAALDPSAFASGVTTSAPSRVSQNVVSYPNVSAPPTAKIDPNALNLKQFDRSAINAGRDRTISALDANQGLSGVQFGTDQYSAATDATGAAISTDYKGTVPDWLQQAMGNTSGSSNVTPSLYGDMKQRIAYYKNKDWALDPTINKNMWNAW
tara:strand:- start:71 stop:1183 length:1113 start_codon:yes stop_codon:yes gene_type:complete